MGLVFAQTLTHGFVNLDDAKYVYENPWTAEGLTVHSIRGAFTHVYASNWVPLTWISLMADYQFYGLHAGGYHLTNMLLHAATAMLLFLVLWRMTGRLWLSAAWWRHYSPSIPCGRNRWLGSPSGKTS